MFSVTCLKILGSVGLENLFFKEVMAKLFFQLRLVLFHPNNSTLLVTGVDYGVFYALRIKKQQVCARENFHSVAF